MSRRRDSNPRPADYKSAALPTELHRQVETQSKSFLDQVPGFDPSSGSFYRQLSTPMAQLLYTLIHTTAEKSLEN